MKDTNENSFDHSEEDHKGSFHYGTNGNKLALMTYTWAGEDRIIVDHTEVDDSLRGQGIGEKLVRMSVDFAREKGISIIPLCPFAKSVFQKRNELRDVL